MFSIYLILNVPDSGIAMAYRGSHFGSGQGAMWMDDVECNGSERRLDECHHSGWGVHNCDVDEEAGVACDVKRDQTTTKPVVSTTVPVVTSSANVTSIFSAPSKGTNNCEFYI